MNRITHLTSQRKSHIPNHFEERITEAFGRKWWLVFTGKDKIKPEFVGSDEKLPAYAQKQLAQLRADPKVGARRKARYINASLCFFPGQEDNGIPHRESVDWLRQYARPTSGEYREEKGYLVVTADSHHEDYPLQIWESFPTRRCLELDVLDSEYRLVWKRHEGED